MESVAETVVENKPNFFWLHFVQTGMFVCKHLFIIFFAIYVSSIIYFVFQNDPESIDKSSDITCLILEFENFHNDLFETTKSLCKEFQNVIIYTSFFIYPRVDFSTIKDCQIRLIEEQNLYSTFAERNLYAAIKTNHLLIVPDSVRIHPSVSRISEKLLQLLKRNQSEALVIPLRPSRRITCDDLIFDVKRWTLFDKLNKETNRQILFLKRESLYKLPHPFHRPFIKSFCIQSQLGNLSITVIDHLYFTDGNDLFIEKRLDVKHKQLEEYRTRVLYRTLGVKKLIHSDGSVEWFGCNRQQARCFSTIVDGVPDYLALGRWLPPCCRANLEVTGRYVFSLLEKFNVRYWLEGGSLLGAARDGRIIDWDYDIDIGIYREDASKFSVLASLLDADPGFQIEDGQGFLWEKAIEGDFIKVHYSRVNRIHVDIFPFYPVNGTMTKDTWFEDHPQDMPFPEHFLKPLEKLNFIDHNASVPNNVRQFLELKFGAGCIETPRYSAVNLQ